MTEEEKVCVVNKSLYMYSSNMYTQGASHIPLVTVYLNLSAHTGNTESARERASQETFETLFDHCYGSI